jgi:2-oxoglutarate ferredoxin oxidoreductase subunit beta
LNHLDHDVTSKVSAFKLLEESAQKNEFLTGLIYVDAKRRDFLTNQSMVDTPLALLPDEALRPTEAVLKKIMETI